MINQKIKYYKAKLIFQKYYLLFIASILILLPLGKRNEHKTEIFNNISYKFIKDEFFIKRNEKCDDLDPIYIMGQRLKKPPNIVCENEKSKHFCYQNSKYSHHNKLFKFPNGVICIMKNFTLDPLKSSQTNLIYKGPIDKVTKGSAIISNGFFNMKCKIKKKYKKYSELYKNYFEAWNYDEKEKIEELEELAPGKTLFLINRNQDSPNLFHGLSEFINALSVIYLFDLNPEDIQIVYLESMVFENEPLYDLFSNIISKGNKPIYLRDLKKKYFVSSAINIPVSGDSPLFIFIKSPDCKYSVKTYKIVNNLINDYLNINIFKDSFISDYKVFYYPESTINSHKLNTKFFKAITILWRKVWPKGRINQKRILGNGPELSEKLGSVLPSNYLIRLVDSASLSILKQISLIRKTDYLIGIHGAGLSLSIFMPNTSILHEIHAYKKNQLLLLMSKLSGHKSYSDIVKNRIKIINQNEYIFFDQSSFVECVLKHMKQNNFIN